MTESHEARQVFARRIRESRKALGLSQETLADRAGLHRTYIGHVERAEVNVSIDNMEKIARTLQIPLVDLLQEVKVLKAKKAPHSSAADRA